MKTKRHKELILNEEEVSYIFKWLKGASKVSEVYSEDEAVYTNMMFYMATFLNE